MIDAERLKKIKYLSRECEKTVDLLTDYYEDLKDELDVAIDETEDTLYEEKFCSNRKKAIIVFDGKWWKVYSCEKYIDDGEIGDSECYESLNGSTGKKYVENAILYKIKELISENYEITFKYKNKESD